MNEILAKQPPPDTGDAIVGLIYLIGIVAVLVIVFGKHDDGKRD